MVVVLGRLIMEGFFFFVMGYFLLLFKTTPIHSFCKCVWGHHGLFNPSDGILPATQKGNSFPQWGISLPYLKLERPKHQKRAFKSACHYKKNNQHLPISNRHWRPSLALIDTKPASYWALCRMTNYTVKQKQPILHPHWMTFVETASRKSAFHQWHTNASHSGENLWSCRMPSLGRLHCWVPWVIARKTSECRLQKDAPVGSKNAVCLQVEAYPCVSEIPELVWLFSNYNLFVITQGL